MTDFNDPINDPTKYKFGIFYFNPADDRTIVSKRVASFGWTLNFANPRAYVVICLILIIPFVIFKITN